MSLSQSFAPWQERWSRLADQEKQMLMLIAALVIGAVLWLQILAPARTTLHTADAQAKVLSAQLQAMQKMQSQAQALQKQPPLEFDAALKALALATQQTLGANAQLTNTAERASVTLKGASADALAQWLVEARLNARSAPTEAHLVRTTTPAGSVWNGVLIMSLPTR